jgi:hypothetical protein
MAAEPQRHLTANAVIQKISAQPCHFAATLEPGPGPQFSSSHPGNFQKAAAVVFFQQPCLTAKNCNAEQGLRAAAVTRWVSSGTVCLDAPNPRGPMESAPTSRIQTRPSWNKRARTNTRALKRPPLRIASVLRMRA